MHKERVVKWIDKNWDYIKKEMEDKLPVRPKLGKVYKNIFIAQEAYELHASGKSYKQISDILMDKYPTNTQVCDPTWLKTVTFVTKLKTTNSLVNFLHLRAS